MGILTIISLLITLLPQILQATGVVSPAIASLIADLGSALPGLFTSLAAGGGPTKEVIAVLTAFQSEIAALQKDSSLDANSLQLASTLNGALTAALAAYAAAQAKDDPSTLQELPTNL